MKKSVPCVVVSVKAGTRGAVALADELDDTADVDVDVEVDMESDTKSQWN